ncbi:unnamed protein product [Peronospora destructor]|uniref:Uncharacterized protein n=1 Tax=Peronospora destructor TaxID=86335 RepID=A0AAV0VFB0_9STRA|nr:unnamed protein product [Peronospora destructor]
MDYAFDCILGIPWLARFQPQIDWLARSVKRRSGFDVRSSLDFSCNHERDIDVVEQGLPREINAVENGFLQEETVVEQGFPPASNAVENGFPHENNMVEQEFPHEKTVVEQGFPHNDTVVEQGLPCGTTVVEQGFPHETSVVEQGLPHENTAVEKELPHLETTATSSIYGTVEDCTPCLQGSDISPRDCCSPAPSSNSEQHEIPRVDAPASTLVNVIKYVGGAPQRRRVLEVASPPRDASSITHLPGLS